MKKIIITGFARSGSTALTDLLNIDPRIYITYSTRSFLFATPNRRRKWDDRNRKLKTMGKTPIYMGDKCTIVYLRGLEKMIKEVDKIIFCLRDPRDIFRSKYWDIIKEDPVQMYIELMGKALKQDLSKVFFVRYENAVLNVDKTVKDISEYLELDPCLNIEGHNYRPFRRLAWMKKPAVELPKEVYEIMREFGYENTIRS